MRGSKEREEGEGGDQEGVKKLKKKGGQWEEIKESPRVL
jgi:hypothetical protein